MARLKYCARCNGLKEQGHRHRVPDTRLSAARRGYGTAWQRTRKAFLEAHALCIDCGAKATVADHDPVSRRDLVNQGDPDPDGWHHLKPRCGPCHSSRTTQAEPGGFNAGRLGGG